MYILQVCGCVDSICVVGGVCDMWIVCRLYVECVCVWSVHGIVHCV